MTHIFIVNDRTFKYHLQYLFAGTCAKNEAYFIDNPSYKNPRMKKDGLTSKQELTIASMIADVSRIRVGDKIIFYLTQSQNHDGMFFGVFKAVDRAFFDSNVNNYLSNELGVNLNFRIKITAENVYPFGITEREALDSLDNIEHPSQMCWSMIYRKLKGKRGCTMITDYESNRMIQLIKTRNSTMLSGNCFTYDVQNNCISVSGLTNQYKGTATNINIKQRMLFKSKNGHSYEAHLQAYVLQNCDLSPLKELTNQKPNLPLWIGNEVSCGVGMQSIDIMLFQEDNESIYINIIELKCVNPYESIITYQLPQYISWVKDYIAPLYRSKNVIITPTILAPKISNNAKRDKFTEKCNTFKDGICNNILVKSIEYIGYSIDTDIHFEKIF